MTSPQVRRRSGASNRRRRPAGSQPGNSQPRPHPAAGRTRGPVDRARVGHAHVRRARPARAAACGRSPPTASPTRSPSRPRPCPTRSPVATCSAAARPARARRSRSGSPCWPGSQATGRGPAVPAGWSWCPPASSPPRSSTRSCRSPRRSGCPPTAVVGGMSFNRQSSELQRGVDVLVATPGRLADHLDQGTCVARRRHHHGDRRGRPDGRHGLPAAGPAHPRPDAVRRSAAAVLRHPRRRRPHARPALPHRSGDPLDRAADRRRRHDGAPPAARRRARQEPRRRRDRRPRGPHDHVRPHEARRRPAGQAAAPGRRRRRRAARRQGAERPQPGDRGVPRRGDSPCSSPPTSRRAASTSTT